MCIAVMYFFKLYLPITFNLGNIKNSIIALSECLLHFHHLLFSCGFMGEFGWKDLQNVVILPIFYTDFFTNSVLELAMSWSCSPFLVNM